MRKRWQRLKPGLSTIERVMGVAGTGAFLVDFVLNLLREHGMVVSAVLFAALYVYSLYQRFSLGRKIEAYFRDFFYLKKVKTLDDGTIIAEGDIANFLTENTFLQALVVEEDDKGERVEVPVGVAYIAFIQSDRYIVHVKWAQKHMDIDTSKTIYFKPILQTQAVVEGHGS